MIPRSLKTKKPPKGGFFCSRSELPLGELLATAGFVETNLFTFDFTCITSNKTSL
jgi:hypothetical protein